MCTEKPGVQTDDKMTLALLVFLCTFVTIVKLTGVRKLRLANAQSHLAKNAFYKLVDSSFTLTSKLRQLLHDVTNS